MAEKRYLVPLRPSQVHALLRLDRGFEDDLKTNSPLRKALDQIEEDCAGRLQIPKAERCRECKGAGWR